MRTVKAALQVSLAHALLSLALAAALTSAAVAAGGRVGTEVLLGVGILLAVFPWPGLNVLAAYPGRPASRGLGLPVCGDESRAIRAATLATTVLILACVCVVLLDGEVWMRVLLVVAAVVIASAATARLLRAFCTMRRQRAAQRRAILDFAPEVVLYTGRAEGGAYQIRQWLPLLQAVSPKVMVVVRHPTAIENLAAELPGDIPIVCSRENKDLDQVMVPSVRTVFYVNSVTSNANLVSYRSVRHVYLGHGDSDKEISAHPAHRMYDVIFVAGQAAIDRYEAHKVKLDDGQARIIGRPQLDGVLPVSGTRSGPRTVLYAPTWSGYNEASSLSSLAYARPFIADLISRGIRILFRPHPFSRNGGPDAGYVSAIDHLLAVDSGQHLQSEAAGAASLVDLFNDSDAMVADISSLLVDYLATLKPIAALVRSPMPSRTLYPSIEHAYLPSSTAAEAWNQFLSSDPLRERRERAAAYYLGGTSAEMFRQAVFSLDSPTGPPT